MTMNTPARSSRIVVGVDGSPRSIDALRHAADLADVLNTQLHVVTTWTTPPVAYGAPVPLDRSLGDDATDAQHYALKQVFPGGKPDWVDGAVLEGLAAKTLLDESKDATMLVVGSRGHGGFAGLLLGSVSTACAEYAECPVLVYHRGPRS